MYNIRNFQEEINMKIWKKLSLVLCMSFAFSTVATGCDGLFGDNSGSSSSSSSSSLSSSSSSSVVEDSSSTEEDSSSDNTEQDIATKVNIYLALMANKINNSKAAKIRFELKNDGILESGIVESSTTLKAVSGEAIISKNNVGSFNAVIDATVASLENPLQGETKKYYLIDDYVYEYVSDNTYNKHEEKVVDNAIHALTQGSYATLADLCEGLELMLKGEGASTPDLEFEGLEDSFGNIADLDSGLTDEGAWVTADATAKADELFDFLKTVNESTTYAQLFDFVLKQIDPDLTTEKIFDELYKHRNGTVGSLVEELDAKSREETGKSLQENLDEILNNSAIREVIESKLDEETYPGIADMLLSFDIDEFLNRNSKITDDSGAFIKYGDLSLDRLTQEMVTKLVELLGDQASELIPKDLLEKATFATLISVMETFVKEPAFENIEEGSTLDKLLKRAQSVEVSKADIRVEIDAVDDFNVSMVAQFVGRKDSNGTKTDISGTATLNIYEFSTNEVEIKLPEGATINVVHETCQECKEQKEDVTYRINKYGYYCNECYIKLLREEINQIYPNQK